MEKNYAIIVAAGRGSRFKSDLPKQYVALAGQKVLWHTVRAFCTHPKISGVRCIIHPDDVTLYRDAIGDLEVLDFVLGGASRQDSVFNGLKSLEEFQPDHVLIHDAARPFISMDVINRVLDALKTAPGALPALAITDTLKKEKQGLCNGSVDRSGLWGAQTPQGFVYDKIYQAHQSFKGSEFTDDTSVMEAAGHDVVIVEGSEQNFKITTQQDYAKAKMMVESQFETFTGTGFDVHRFVSGDHVTLCGVEIPHNQRLSGHSDADVAMHALTDAILGAMGAGDIGQHFPPSDPQWKGANSEIFLKKARDIMAEAGAQLINLDLTIICERPKIGPHRDAMGRKLAEILGVEASRVSVKGTTTEKLGFTGRGEGIAAQASVSIKRKV